MAEWGGSDNPEYEEFKLWTLVKKAQTEGVTKEDFVKRVSEKWESMKNE